MKALRLGVCSVCTKKRKKPESVEWPGPGTEEQVMESERGWALDQTGFISQRKQEASESVNEMNENSSS